MLSIHTANTVTCFQDETWAKTFVSQNTNVVYMEI